MKYTMDGNRLVINDGVEKIEFLDFFGCYNAVSAFVPASVREFFLNGFSEIYHLESIEVDPASPYFKAVDGVLYTADGKELIAWPRAKSESAVVPEGVELIRTDAMGKNEKITSIHLPASLKSIGEDPCRELAGVRHLERIEVDPASTCFQTADGILYTGDGKTLLYCPRKKGPVVTVPEGVEKIGDGAFCDASLIEAVQLPASLKSIGNAAFEHTTRLHEISIPEGVEEIGEDAFCAWHNMIGTGLHAVSLPSTLKRVGKSAFSNSGLQCVELPDSVDQIRESAFKQCVQLTSARLPSRLKTIENSLFHSCRSLKNVEIPSGVTAIEPGAFAGCASLDHLTIPESVTAIGYYAFSHCQAIKHIEIPAACVSMGRGAFICCSALEEVILHEGLSSIGIEAFAECTKLKSMSIPSTVTQIGEKAFFHTAVKFASVSIADFTPEIAKEFRGLEIEEIHTADIDALPAARREAAAVGFSREAGADGDSERAKKHREWISKNATKLLDRAMLCPELMKLMLEQKLIQKKALSAYIERAALINNQTLTDQLEDYAKTIGASGGEMRKGAQAKAEKGKQEIGARTAVHREGFDKAVYALDGKPKIFKNKAALEFTLLCVGAKLTGSVSEKTDALIVSDSTSASIVRKKAEQLGIREITEEELMNKLSAIEEIYVPDDTEEIPAYGLAKLRGMRRVILPKGLKAIRQSAFSDCRGLTEIDIPDTVEFIGRDAFGGTCIEIVRVPDAVHGMPANAIETTHFINASAKKTDGLMDDDDWCHYPMLAVIGSVEQLPGISTWEIAYRGDIADLPSDRKFMAVKGLLRLERMGDETLAPWRGSYVAWIRADKKRVSKLLDEDTELLLPLIRLAAIPAGAVNEIQKRWDVQKRPELMAALLEYCSALPEAEKKRVSRAKDQGFDKQIQHMTEAADRREKAQGIAGLSFVATGSMKNFGDADEYTGAVDWSDLKAYIEARGGFLRSAVSGKTDYLICNDPDLSTTKAIKARELGIPLITEEEFLRMADEKR